MNQPAQQQHPPGQTDRMNPRPDHGEESYQGSGRLAGKAAVITGADSGIGRAAAIAFAREGADVVVSYLDEHEDAEETRTWVEQAGRKAVLVPGDLADPAHCRAVIDKAVAEFGKIDVLVSNAAQQRTYEKAEDIPDDDWDRTLAVNLSAFFYLTKAALPHMGPGSSIIGTSSVNSDSPTPTLLPYDVTKAGIANMTAALAQLLAPRGIRANSVAPGEADSDGFENLLAGFIMAGRIHIAFEEGAVWPPLRAALSARDAEELGRKLEEAKKSAPTRPHPRTPPHPGILKTAGAAAAAADRIRDAATDRND